MTDDERPMNFASLDPTRSEVAFERRLDAIREGTRFAMRRRRHVSGTATVLTRWRAPLFATAAVIIAVSAALSGGAAGTTGTAGAVAETAATTDQGDEIADALGMSTTLGSALLSDSASVEDVLLAGYWR